MSCGREKQKPVRVLKKRSFHRRYKQQITDSFRFLGGKEQFIMKFGHHVAALLAKERIRKQVYKHKKRFPIKRIIEKPIDNSLNELSAWTRRTDVSVDRTNLRLIQQRDPDERQISKLTFVRRNKENFINSSVHI